MIQSIYTSVSNADTVSNTKGTVVKSDPIPLIKDKFLGEFRTELEKAKVRKNLGIPDENSLEWGNIAGFVEQQTDLVNYVESKWNYTTELNDNVTNIKEAMDYALYFVTNFKGEHDSIVSIQSDISSINSELNTINDLINTNVEDISELNSAILKINEDIISLNESLLSINVDANILAWVEKTLLNSKSLEIKDEILEVVISRQAGNALQILEHLEAVEEDLENGIEAVEEILPGLYIKDLTPDVKNLEESQSEINLRVDNISENLTEISVYNTLTPDKATVPTTVGGISAGTTADLLKGKTIDWILDSILFPSVIRDLIYPYAYYSYVEQLVEVGTSIVKPTLYFSQGDAGSEKTEERIDILTFDGSEVTEDTYSKLGTYYYQGTISYEHGEYLIDNKGDVTDRRIEEGSVSTSTSVTTTYPWFIDGVKLNLIQFGQQSSEILFTLKGVPTIKIPGKNSTYKFEIYGLGWGDVNLEGWNLTTENDPTYGIEYQILSKKVTDPYEQDTQFKIKLNLQL